MKGCLKRAAFFHGQLGDILYVHAMKASLVWKTKNQNQFSPLPPWYDDFFL
jgi:hypothetical protein